MNGMMTSIHCDKIENFVYPTRSVRLSCLPKKHIDVRQRQNGKRKIPSNQLPKVKADSRNLSGEHPESFPSKAVPATSDRFCGQTIMQYPDHPTYHSMLRVLYHATITHS